MALLDSSKAKSKGSTTSAATMYRTSGFDPVANACWTAGKPYVTAMRRGPLRIHCT